MAGMLEKEPLISVIVPVYNTGRYLARCMESLARQTYGNLEIILIDDGSTDNSPAMCDAYAEEMNHVRVIHKENAGLGFARNSGLDVASGEYISFLDSDDYVDKNMYLRLITECQKENVAAVFCDYDVVKNDGAHISIQSNLNAGIYTGKQIVRAMSGADPESQRDFDFSMSACMGIYSKCHIDSIALRFSSERSVISEDYLFNVQFLQKAEKVSYVRECLYCYCENEGSLTHRYIPNRLNKEKDLYWLIKKLVGEEMSEEDLIRFQRLFLGRIRVTIAQEVHYKKRGSFIKSISEIRKIAQDELVRVVIESYPINRNPLKLRIFNTFLKWEICVGMYFLILLKG